MTKRTIPVGTKLSQEEVDKLDNYLIKTNESRSQYIKRLILRDIENSTNNAISFERKVLRELGILKSYAYKQDGSDPERLEKISNKYQEAADNIKIYREL